MIKEKPTKGVRGFILYSPFDKKGGRYFFRIYHSEEQFMDYDIRAEEIEVELDGEWLSLYESENGQNYLDWSSKAIGRPNKNS
jgi:hypothetical protein